MAAFPEECDGQRVLVSPTLDPRWNMQDPSHPSGVELMGGWSWVELDCDVVIDCVHVTMCF